MLQIKNGMLTWFLIFTDILEKMKKILLLSVLYFTVLNLIYPCQIQGQDSQQKPVSRIVEDGGTGPYSAIMLTEPTLQTHTVFRPADLTPFGAKNKLPVIAWGNGACANSPWEHVNFLSEVASRWPGDMDRQRRKQARPQELLEAALDALLHLPHLESIG